MSETFASQGVGFDMRCSGELFGSFRRMHRKEELEGTGTGLTTVRGIVHLYGAAASRRRAGSRLVLVASAAHGGVQ